MKAMIVKALNAAIVLLCHGGLATLLVGSVRGTEYMIGPSVRMFGILPLAWVFRGIDLAAILLFGVMGLTEAYRVLR